MNSLTTLLAVIEELEAEQINLGLYNTRLTPTTLFENLRQRQTPCSLDEIEENLRRLVSQGELIEWMPNHFRSRIGETVRILRLLRQRFWPQKHLSDAPLLIEDIRVAFRERRRPKRQAIEMPAVITKAAPPALAPLFEQTLASLGFTHFSGFQARAIEQIFRCAQGANVANEAFIVAGDTGAGKTEAFLFPVLMDIAVEAPDLRRQPGVRALLVYPRIRLARNQLGRLLRYTKALQAAGGPRVTVGIQNGDVPGNFYLIRTEKKWKRKRDSDQTWHRLELLESCVACGEGHYWFASDDSGVDAGCPGLVCDVCGHTIDSLHITQSALEKNAPDIMIITDVSLSQWLAREKYSHLWGLWEGDTITVPPRFLVLDEVHLYERLKGAHIARLVKRFQARVQLVYQRTGQSTRKAVIIGVSATLHDEQRFLAKLMDIDPQDKAQFNRLQVIKPFEDELEPTGGRERYIFLNPRGLSPTSLHPEHYITDQTAAIYIIMAAMHNLKTQENWRALAFFDSINLLRQFYANYAATGTFPPSANEQENFRIRTDRRWKGGETFNDCGDICARRAGEATLHLCPHFRTGDCWVFAKLHGWNDSLRVANSVYAGSISHLERQDLIPTSPSLEVGYDDDAIQLVYQHKAPPNAASFIQRRGRAGRRPDDSPVIITLLWPYRRDDAFYFFHPEALYDPAFDDVPLNAGNFNVQRSHTLLAFFDLLACLRRQNLDNLAKTANVVDFTDAGWDYFTPNDEVIAEVYRNSRANGQSEIVIRHRETQQLIRFKGKMIADKHIIDKGFHLRLRGWLLMDKHLSHHVLRPAWERIKDLFPVYLDLAGIASETFRRHHSYPFQIDDRTGRPEQLLQQFGQAEWHSAQEKMERANWLKSYRHIDWMLQGNEDATTLTVHYPNPENGASRNNDEPEELTTAVNFGLMELLPGNVTYRLRETKAIHWTPVPRDGESTFLYPEEPVVDDTDQPVGRRWIEEFLPEIDDISSKAESIFGVPRYLHEWFEGLRFMSLRRLRVETFGSPDHQLSNGWYYDPDQETTFVHQKGAPLPKGSFRISRRSSVRANSIIIPYIAASRRISRRQLLMPLTHLFGAIDGFLEEGTAMLGYTRAFYEMEIDLRGDKQQVTLHRHFYPPKPILDEANRPQPILVGYKVETQGIRFQVNPDILAQTIEATLADENLRLHLRRSFAIYRMARYATKWNVFMRTHLDTVGIVVDYWLQRVVLASSGAPRLLSRQQDLMALVDFYAASKVVQKGEIEKFAERLHDKFFEVFNSTLQVAFKDTSAFNDFLESVILHSLSALLKNLIARLGGVGTDDLVAYADLPVLDQVDCSIEPRILIMDTVEGGSGGIAQAFDRLDLTDNEGSLWWMLQTELGNCPIAHGEALTQAVLSRASKQQIRAVQQTPTLETLSELLTQLQLDHPATAALQALGRALFTDLNVGDQTLNPALIMKELFALQAKYQALSPGEYSRESTVCRAAASPDPAQQPHIHELRQALVQSGISDDDLAHELGLQLRAMFEQGCFDGCPVCLGSGSDIEHYYLADLLNSRRVLKKLRQVLTDLIPTGTSVIELRDILVQGQAVQVSAPPGTLSNRLDPTLGLAVVAQVDEEGQARSASTIIVDSNRAREFLQDGKWDQRWGGDNNKPYQTRGGVRVRSRAEYIIATKLEDANIAFEYEPRLAYRDEDKQTHFIHPDFYLFEHNLYVEYWGRDDPEYIESRRYKEQVYQQLVDQRGIQVLHLEMHDIEFDAFMDKIQKIIS